MPLNRLSKMRSCELYTLPRLHMSERQLKQTTKTSTIVRPICPLLHTTYTRDIKLKRVSPPHEGGTPSLPAPPNLYDRTREENRAPDRMISLVRQSEFT